MQLVTQIPIEADEFALGIAVDPFTVAAELRIMLGQEQQPCVDPSSERVNQAFITEMSPDLPVGSHRSEIHDRGVGDWCLLWGRLGVGHGEKLYLVPGRENSLRLLAHGGTKSSG